MQDEDGGDEGEEGYHGPVEELEVWVAIKSYEDAREKGAECEGQDPNIVDAEPEARDVEGVVHQRVVEG